MKIRNLILSLVVLLNGSTVFAAYDQQVSEATKKGAETFEAFAKQDLPTLAKAQPTAFNTCKANHSVNITYTNNENGTQNACFSCMKTVKNGITTITTRINKEITPAANADSTAKGTAYTLCKQANTALNTIQATFTNLIKTFIPLDSHNVSSFYAYVKTYENQGWKKASDACKLAQECEKTIADTQKAVADQKAKLVDQLSDAQIASEQEAAKIEDQFKKDQEKDKAERAKLTNKFKVWKKYAAIVKPQQTNPALDATVLADADIAKAIDKKKKASAVQQPATPPAPAAPVANPVALVTAPKAEDKKPGLLSRMGNAVERLNDHLTGQSSSVDESTPAPAAPVAAPTFDVNKVTTLLGQKNDNAYASALTYTIENASNKELDAAQNAIKTHVKGINPTTPAERALGNLANSKQLLQDYQNFHKGWAKGKTAEDQHIIATHLVTDYMCK